ncbi:DHH family phosphoesterase [Halorussus salinisoli]|uniref:DHH family phosphoesterase n=1 Tax=Halorussus salinisoli TaxID=2558242 RepID=UPI0010C22B20|nr:bifunctional oligoribonuclease/PAP phosphatase NrnA [Halorussus salinisoli]
MTEAETLYNLLTESEELTIVCHNNPDPDCLASALALGRIATHAGIDERRILYSGDISHQQSRAFVNLLELDLKQFDAETVRDRAEDSLVAFVDHSIPGVNNEVPEDVPIDVVIDHHTAEGIEARFVDHREGVGATATILTEYVRDLGVEPDEILATGLLFAIRRETLGFLRGVTRDEYGAAQTLHDHADLDMLRRLSTPAVSGATVDAIADAVDNRTVRGSVLISHVGRTSERDSLPQAADYLATLEGVETAIVFGIVDDEIEISARSTDSRVHIGNVLDDIFEDVGSAGGHREMAGGQIPLGVFADLARSETGPEFVDIVARVVTNRLVTGLKLGDEASESGTDAA